MEKFQALITRMPYAARYDAAVILEESKKIDERGLICVSLPIHVDHPMGPFKWAVEMERAGLTLVSSVAWLRDRLVVTLKSKRLTNSWEPLFIFAKSPEYILDRNNTTKVKKGFEGREGCFDEDEFQCCVGDHWPVRNDRRDRRFMPGTVVMNCAQLAGLQPQDKVYDPYGNPGIKEVCAYFGWGYVDGGLPSAARIAGEKFEEQKVA